jgi:NADPH:quinone reductase-like Zn-dependent oxidoreductase
MINAVEPRVATGRCVPRKSPQVTLAPSGSLLLTSLASSLRQLAESGQVTLVIDGTFPLAEAPQAIRRLDAGQVRGKLAITIRGEAGPLKS